MLVAIRLGTKKDEAMIDPQPNQEPLNPVSPTTSAAAPISGPTPAPAPAPAKSFQDELRVNRWLQATIILVAGLFLQPLFTFISFGPIVDGFQSANIGQSESGLTVSSLLLSGFMLGVLKLVGNVLLSLVCIAIFKRLRVALTFRRALIFLLLVAVFTFITSMIAGLGLYYMFYLSMAEVPLAWVLVSRPVKTAGGNLA
jgi:hypothetical protein